MLIIEIGISYRNAKTFFEFYFKYNWISQKKHETKHITNDNKNQINPEIEFTAKNK